MDNKRTYKKVSKAIITEPVGSNGVTKEDLFNTMRELLDTAKDIQRMMKDFHADNFITK
jgi:hypothetical protein